MKKIITVLLGLTLVGIGLYWLGVIKHFGANIDVVNVEKEQRDLGSATNTSLQNLVSTEDIVKEILPSGCSVVGGEGDLDPSDVALGASEPYRLSSSEKLVFCSTGNNAARTTLAPMLKSKGWTFCESGLAGASWSKDNIRLSLSESAGTADNPIPFRIRITMGVNCNGMLY